MALDRRSRRSARIRHCKKPAPAPVSAAMPPPRSATPRHWASRWSIAWALAVTVALGAPPARATCAGDCGTDGAVTIDDLVRGVAIALGSSPATVCPAADGNGDGQVTIPELVQAVNAALNGCPPAPTGSPAGSPSSTPPATAPATDTPAPTQTATPRATASATPSTTPTVTVDPERTPTETRHQPNASSASPTSPTPPGCATSTTTSVAILARGGREPWAASPPATTTATDGSTCTSVTGDHPNLLLRNSRRTFARWRHRCWRSTWTAAAIVRPDLRRLRRRRPARSLRRRASRAARRTCSATSATASSRTSRAPSGLTALAGRQNLGAAFGDYDRDGDLDLFVTHWGTRLAQRRRHRLSVAQQRRPHASPTSALPPVSLETPHPAFVDADVHAQLRRHRRRRLARPAGRRRLRPPPPSCATASDGTFAVEPGGRAHRRERHGRGGRRLRQRRRPRLVRLQHLRPQRRRRGAAGASPATASTAIDGDGSFDDATDAAGVRDGFWGWGACFADFDNDGWLDLFQVNGWGLLDLGNGGAAGARHGASSTPIRRACSCPTATAPSASAPRTSGVADRGQGRGVVCFDYDRDGDIDLFIANNGGPPTLFRNDFGTAQHWLAVGLRGRAPNTEAHRRARVRHRRRPDADARAARRQQLRVAGSGAGALRPRRRARSSTSCASCGPTVRSRRSPTSRSTAT